MKNNGCKRAFTLIELLVVVLIIGILAAIALPQYQKAVEKARAAEMLTWVGNAKRAIELYVLENGGISSSMGETDLLKENMGSVVLTSGLTCPEEATAHYCYSKNYIYAARCSNSGCTLGVGRTTSTGNASDLKMTGIMDTTDGKTWTVSDETGYPSGDGTGKIICEAFVKTFGGTCDEF